MSVAVFTSFAPQLDSSGNVLSGGSVTVYQAGTTTPITLKAASDLSGSAAANPIVLDSAGRHAIMYFALQSYKTLLKNSAGSTIATVDNIDPGIAIGTGALAIANGGTGAASAGAALTALGGATAASVASVAADVASLAGTLSATDKTHIATGTTGQRPASPIEGDIRRNTTTQRYESHDGANWWNFITSNFGALETEDTTPDPANDFLLEYDNSAGTIKKTKPSSLATILNATQAQQETGTATIALVSPAVQQFHPSAPKCWGKFDVSAAFSVSYNVTSGTDNGTGDWTITIGTDFSSANYAPTYGGEQVTATDRQGLLQTRLGGQAAGTLRVIGSGGAQGGTIQSPLDLSAMYFSALGDQ